MMGSNSMETFTTPFQLTLGWNLIGCYYDGNNFDPLTSVGTNYCYNIMHDGTAFQSAPIIHTTGNYTDEDTFITCVGGDKYNGGNSRSSLVGMTNQVQAYSDPITLGQMQTMVSYDCDAPCPMCLAKMAPTCQEYVKEAYVGKWDFKSDIYQNLITDQGNNGLNIQLNDDQDIDPVYVDNQGLYFNGRNHIRTSGTWLQNNQESFTYEAWIRPSNPALDGQQLFSIDNDTNAPEFSIKLNSGNIEVDMEGTTRTFPITAPVADEWTYVAVSVMKIANNRVNV